MIDSPGLLYLLYFRLSHHVRCRIVVLRFNCKTEERAIPVKNLIIYFETLIHQIFFHIFLKIIKLNFSDILIRVIKVRVDKNLENYFSESALSVEYAAGRIFDIIENRIRSFHLNKGSLTFVVGQY